jgi:hypothetical protein
VFNFKASPVYSTWQASDIPNHVTHQPSQADLCCGDCACLFQALTERRVNGGFVRFQAIRSRCAWSTLDIRSAGAFKKALARREESRDRADTIGTGQPAPPGRVPCDHPSPQAPAARVEPQLEMTHIAKNTTDMHAPPGSSRACRHRMVSLEPELTSTSSAGLGSNAYHPRYHHRSRTSNRSRGLKGWLRKSQIFRPLRDGLGGGPAAWRAGYGVSRARASVSG